MNLKDEPADETVYFDYEDEPKTIRCSFKLKTHRLEMWRMVLEGKFDNLADWSTSPSGLTLRHETAELSVIIALFDFGIILV